MTLDPTGLATIGALHRAEIRIAALEKALRFYADPESWQARGHSQIDADTVPVTRDGGRRARKALSATADPAKESKL